MSTKDDQQLALIYENMLNEEMGSGDVVGNSGAEYGGAVGNEDFYAPGDTRIPKSIFGGVQTRNGETKRKKKCRCKKGEKCKCRSKRKAKKS